MASPAAGNGSRSPSRNGPRTRLARSVRALGFASYWLGAAVALLLVIELGLRLFDSEAGLPFDPLAGFSSRVPLFEPATRADGTAVLRVSAARLASREPSPTERELLASKPEPGFRIFIVGGSSEAGFPYPPAYAFGAWLERRLRAALPHAGIEVVNAAMSGYGSRRILLVAREIAAYQPDLVIVSCGHNEWAERRYYSRYFDMPLWLFHIWERVATTRLVGRLARLHTAEKLDADQIARRLVRDERQEFTEMFGVMAGRAAGQGYASEQEMARRDALYRANLESIVATAQRAGARVVLLGLVQNFADWAPGASTHRAELAAADLKAWQQAFELGAQAAARGDCAGALESWQRALAIDAEYALLHFELGGCQRKLGAFARARESFRRASDLDRVPHGAPTGYDDVLRDVARERGALFVDVASRLEREAPHHLLGDELFVEFVHPNLRAHQLIADEIADALREAGIPRAASAWRAAPLAGPAPDALYAADPQLRVREHEARMVLCALALRTDCVERERQALTKAP